MLEENRRLLVAALEPQEDRFGVQGLGELLGQAELLGQHEGELDAGRGEVVCAAEEMEPSELGGE